MTTAVVTEKRDIRKLKLEELKAFFVAQGDKAFRAQQVHEWLWKKSAKDFEQMTNLSLATRELLEAHFTINHIRVDNAAQCRWDHQECCETSRRLGCRVRPDSNREENNGLRFITGGLQPGMQVLRHWKNQAHAQPELG